MITKNTVYIATSLDGYIADKDGGLDWLNSTPNPDNIDMGFYSFMDQIDALLMGRNTFETVVDFGGEWPYSKPVFVLSNSLTNVPEHLSEKVFIINGSLTEVLNQLHQQGKKSLYIDGGLTVQNFLKEDLIDELIITTMPILLGGGVSLFGKLTNELKFELVKSEVFLGQLVQNHYKRKR